MTLPEARALVRELADSVSGEDTGWAAGLATLGGLDGRSWLLVDQAARSFTYGDGTPVGGAQGWLGTSLDEPSGFVAAITSLHVDGRFRERAVRALGVMPPEVAVPALTVRLLDHVSQVREGAWAELRRLVRDDTAEAVLDVLLAGANRQHAAAALSSVKAALLENSSSAALVAQLMLSNRRRVRRWALVFGLDQDLFVTEQLVWAVQRDADQWVRAVCADWLLKAPDPSMLVDLLDARSVEARLVALTRVPEAGLSKDALSHLLVDRAPRVREQARWRAGRRGWDIAGFYRATLADGDAAPRVSAACLDGLATTGGDQDLLLFAGRLRHPSGRVRAAAVGAVGALASNRHAVEMLTPILVDSSPRVSTAAAKALSRLAVPPSAAEPAWASGHPSTRRAGWRLARAAGGWHRVEADLRAAADTDLQLSALGRTGVDSWLDVSAATTWVQLPDDQRARIASRLDNAGLGRDQRRVLAFHAGIKLIRDELETQPDKDAPEPAPSPAKRARWLKLLRRT